MESSIFTKIINGEIPAYKIYEDPHVLAILNIHPAQPGHLLVFPKMQIDKIEDLPEMEYIALMVAVKKIMLQVREKLQPLRVCTKVQGFHIAHAHVHIIPCKSDQDSLIEDVNSRPDTIALTQMADTLRFG